MITRNAMICIGLTILAGCATKTFSHRPTLTPSIPGVFRTGINHCGNPYGINATTTQGTIALLDCPGLAGLEPTPTLHVHVADEILISGVPKTASLTLEPDTLSQLGPGLYATTTPGTVSVTINNHLCHPPRETETQPRSCALLKIVTS